MQEKWRKLIDYPGYSVSEWGRVRNDETGSILTVAFTERGISFVGLMIDGRQVKRSIPVLVAKTFLPDPGNDAFNTPIHLDGNKQNCCVANLMWRPRWFAVKYHRQFEIHRGYYVPAIQDLSTGEVFYDIWIPIMRYGICYSDIMESITNGEIVWPVMKRFQRYKP